MIIVISYNARYAKLRGAKKAHFPDFWRSRPVWLIFGLASTVLRILHFYHILLISLFHAYRLFLHYALLHRFDCDSFCSCKHLCACFITFHAAFYNLQFAAMVGHLLLRRHYFARFYQIVSMDAPVCMDADCLYC